MANHTLILNPLLHQWQGSLHWWRNDFADVCHSDRAFCVGEKTISLMCATTNVTCTIPTSNNSINSNSVKDSTSLAVVMLRAMKILAIDVERLISLIHLFAVVSSSSFADFFFVFCTYNFFRPLLLEPDLTLCPHTHYILFFSLTKTNFGNFLSEENIAMLIGLVLLYPKNHSLTFLKPSYLFFCVWQPLFLWPVSQCFPYARWEFFF